MLNSVGIGLSGIKFQVNQFGGGEFDGMFNILLPKGDSRD